MEEGHMRTHLDCIPCFQRQALQAARFVTDDAAIQEACLRRVLEELVGMDWRSKPPDMAHVVHRIVREECGVRDPYQAVKKEYNDIGLAIYPEMRKLVEDSEEPLLTAVRLAIAGNVIDFGASSEFDLSKTLHDVLWKVLSIHDYDALVRELERAGSIAYLADNAGEIVLDRLLLETILDRFDVGKVLFVVKGAPIINDATGEDAEYAGLGALAGLEFVKVGIGEQGTGPERDSDEFMEMLDGVDVVLSKGQGNYEALSERSGIFFLLMAKCPVIAEDLNVEVGDIILKRSIS
jgi:uncharacterized protein with ATP-grasp and redox domains